MCVTRNQLMSVCWARVPVPDAVLVFVLENLDSDRRARLGCRRGVFTLAGCLFHSVSKAHLLIHIHISLKETMVKRGEVKGL